MQQWRIYQIVGVKQEIKNITVLSGKCLINEKIPMAVNCHRNFFYTIIAILALCHLEILFCLNWDESVKILRYNREEFVYRHGTFQNTIF